MRLGVALLPTYSPLLTLSVTSKLASPADMMTGTNTGMLKAGLTDSADHASVSVCSLIAPLIPIGGDNDESCQ